MKIISRIIFVALPPFIRVEPVIASGLEKEGGREGEREGEREGGKEKGRERGAGRDRGRKREGRREGFGTKKGVREE